MYKVCKKCKRIFPATTDYFFKTQNTKSGLSGKCKKCCNKATSDYRKSDARNQYVNSLYERMGKGELLGFKKCKKCERVCPANLQYFYKHATCSFGLMSMCKKCQNKENAINKTKPANCEKRKQREENYRRNNVIKRKMCDKKYRQDNLEKIKARERASRLNNIETYRMRDKKYAANNPDKVRVKHARGRHRRRAREKETEVYYTSEQWAICLEFFDHSCAYCGVSGVPLEKEHLVPVSRGGEFTINNIIPACKSCNSSKQTKPFNEWYPRQSFYRKTRYNQITKYLNIAGTVQQASLFL